MDSSALFGFAGVLVGAGSTYFTEKRVEIRKNRADASVGVRLVLNDLELIQALLGQSLKRGKWWTNLNLRLKTDNWDLYQKSLARELRLDDWHVVRDVFLQIGLLNEMVEQQAEEDIDDKLTEGERESAERILGELGDVDDLLAALCRSLEPRRERVRSMIKRRRTAESQSGSPD